MKSEWKKIELSEVITDIAAGPFGSNLKVSSFVPYGFPIIDGANLKGFKVTDNVTKFVTEEKARSLSRSIAKRGDVVVTISGTLGQIAYIPQDSKFPEYLCSQRQFRISFDENRVYVPYLVFYFHTYEGQNKILSFANQTGVPALSQPLKNFKKIVVSLPSLDEQKKIAGAIECLNDKIELNNKINDNLEQQAQVIYAKVFLSDQFRTKATIKDVSLNVTDGVHNTVQDDPNGNYFLLSCKNIKGGHLTIGNSERIISKETFEKLRKRTKLEKGDILLSSVGTVGELMLLKTEPNNFEFQRSVAMIKPNPQIVSSLFLYEALLAQKESIIHAAHGAVQQCIFISDICDFIVPLPTREELKQFDDIVNPMFAKAQQITEENERLVSIRDTLLPKLMSGEIDVTSTEVL